jgi:voltage-gated potassium channel
MELIKKKVYALLDQDNKQSFLTRLVNLFLVLLILGNVLALILLTVKEYQDKYAGFFKVFEVFSVLVFTAEYGLRLWVCDLNKQYAEPVKGKIKYALSPLAIIDLLSILPFFLQVFGIIDLRVLGLLRYARLLRIFKLKRYIRSLQIIWRVFASKKEEMTIALLTIIFLLVVFSTLVYIAEHHVQPDKFSSIPATMWWGITTLTTVGYGDMVPITPLGKMFAGVAAIFGIGIFAFPAGIISAGFAAQLQKKNDRKKSMICPHCGEKINNKEVSKHVAANSGSTKII